MAISAPPVRSAITASKARGNAWKDPRFHALLARIDLAEGGDPTPHLDEVRDWTSRTGYMRHIIEAYLLTARHLLAKGDPQLALGEAEAGLLHAVSCGYGLLRIELLVAMARIRLAWRDAPKAIQAAREALDLAAHMVGTKGGFPRASHRRRLTVFWFMRILFMQS